jgi:hypothetical protein
MTRALSEVVCILRNLVNRHCSHYFGNVGGNTEGLDKFECG